MIVTSTGINNSIIDTKLYLEAGFLINDLYKKIDGYILSQYTLKGIYNN